MAVANNASAVDLRDWGRKFPASQRFVVLSQFNNRAVLDKETQLAWVRTPSANKTMQLNAISSCAGSVIGGRGGWRLPAVHEMSSLADPAAPIGTIALPAGHPFTSVTSEAYWTATIRKYSTEESRYYVDLRAGGWSNIAQFTVELRYWCVRGGSGTGEY